MESEIFIFTQSSKSVDLQLRIIIVIKIINANDLLTPI